MKIVHIISSLGTGGAELMLFRLAKEMKKGHEIIVISLTEGGELKSKFEDIGIYVKELKLKSSPFATTFKLYKLLKSINPDVLQTWMYHADLLGGFIGRVARIKKIFWGVRNTDVPIGSKATYFLAKLCGLLSNVLPNRIIAVADSAVSSHVKLGYSLDQFTVIPNGYEIPLSMNTELSIRNVKLSLGVDDKVKLVGILGRYHQDKGQDIFLDIIEGINANNVKYLLIGRGCDSANEQLTTSLKQKGLCKEVILVGATDNPLEYLQALDVFCLPSRTEGFPNALAEAILMGTRAIAFDVGDAQKLACSTVSFIPAGDKLAFKSKLIAALQSVQEFSAEDLDASREFVVANYSIKSISDRYLRYYS
jgi:glycosyltransferase involved in cell wall biosynthesis